MVAPFPQICSEAGLLENAPEARLFDHVIVCGDRLSSPQICHNRSFSRDGTP